MNDRERPDPLLPAGGELPWWPRALEVLDLRQDDRLLLAMPGSIRAVSFTITSRRGKLSGSVGVSISHSSRAEFPDASMARTVIS